MRRNPTPLLLAILGLGFVSLGVQSECDPDLSEGPRPSPIERLERWVGGIEGMLLDTKKAVCRLYVLTGNAEELPGFCPKPPGVCEQPIVVGPCEAAIPRWAFDADRNQCVEFTYGGCQGNDNNFASREDCERVCPDDPLPVCRQLIEVGPCDAAIPRWAFDAGAGSCVRFVYGGCGGNQNNFETLTECERACPGEPVPVCELPPDPGPCEAYIPRWFHDPSSGRCERFIYGGCQGNANNFETLAQCERACVGNDVCALPQDPGPCKAAIPRWYHNADAGRCERFIYGGCLGNANNFTSLAECEKACPLCDPSLCGPHQECRLFRDPDCVVAQPPACVEPFCADLCDAGACPPGTVCELVERPCFRAPCPPVRVCRPLDACETVSCQPWQRCEIYEPTGEPFCRDTCEGFPCPEGQRCSLEDVVCIRAPCPPHATCVGDGGDAS